MAIMRRCCCCGVRSGSIACGIYSLIIATIGGLMAIVNLRNIEISKETLYEAKQELPEYFGDLDIDSYVCAVKATNIFSLIVFIPVIITSIVLFVGINKDAKEMLIPFVGAKGFGLLGYIVGFSVSIHVIVQMGTEIAGYTLVASLIAIIPFFAADVVCILCVISQYQEYRDGRGRLCDNMNQTNVVLQQQTLPPGSGGFAYQAMPDKPPSYYDAQTAEKGESAAI